jgi:hypothetical protein
MVMWLSRLPTTNGSWPGSPQRGRGVMSLPNPDAGRWCWDLTGPDRSLFDACADLRVGRWHAADEVLRAAVGDHGLRASRSQALGSVAAGLDIAETWVREHPDSAEARVVFARAAAARALRAHRDGGAGAQQLAVAAVEASEAALEPDGAENDPTPFVIMLSVARVAGLPRYQARHLMDLPGPWGLFEEVRRRDAVGREAHHRMLAYFSAGATGGSHAQMWDFAMWAAEQAPKGSPVRLLPLFARARQYQATRRESFAYRQWTDPAAREQVADGYEFWFLPTPETAQVPVADLSMLAYALNQSFGKCDQTACVLKAMMPYACPFPWNIDGAAAEQLDGVVARCGLRPP